MTNANAERSRKHMAVMDDKRKIEEIEAKLAKATDALKELIFLSNEGDIVDWLNALARAQELMAEIKGE